MSKRIKITTEAAAEAALRDITTRYGGDAVTTITIALALWLRGKLAGATEDDTSSGEGNEFHDRVAMAVRAAKTLRAECGDGDDDTGFDGPLPTDWASAKAAVGGVITGVAWGDE